MIFFFFYPLSQALIYTPSYEIPFSGSMVACWVECLQSDWQGAQSNTNQLSRPQVSFPNGFFQPPQYMCAESITVYILCQKKKPNDYCTLN